MKFSAIDVQEQPDYLTIQIEEKKHIHLSPEFLQYVNHSCSPNVLFNTSTMNFECVSDILQGDQLTFFYPATEWDMSQPFECNCGSTNCLGLIKGASATPLSGLKKYTLSAFISLMLERMMK